MNDRDALVDRALRQALRAPDAATVTEACLDAETMAAWMDGGLPDAAQVAAQAHIAGCARCRALAGAMARTELATPALATIGRSRRWLGWAIPLTTAAVIVIAALLPRKPIAPAPAAQRQENAAQPRARTAAPVEPNVMAEAPLRDKLEREAELAKREDAKKSFEKKDRADIQSSDPSVRWRVREDRIERSTDSGDTWLPLTSTTRDEAGTRTVVAAEIVAASSPSPTVCWFVGRRGLIWISTDGRTVQRLTFSEMTDLSAVTATDARTATVTIADGREFHTTDAGKTWVRRFLQDF